MGVILTSPGGAGGGGGASSDELTGWAKHARKGYTFITFDSDDEAIEGEIPLKTSDDLIVDGPTVKTPYGYYDKEESKTVASGEQGKPWVTKDASKTTHKATFTPHATDKTGWIVGEKKDGDAGEVTASELVSGNRECSISPDDQKNIDVTNYETVSIKGIGYNGKVNDPTVSKSADASKHKATFTPSVSWTTGYVKEGSKNGEAKSVEASELVSGNKECSSSPDDQKNIDVTNYKTVSIKGIGYGGKVNDPTVSKSVDAKNHKATFTPGVSWTTGYVKEGSKNGNADSVTAKELVSGTREETTVGTYDVTNYASFKITHSGTRTESVPNTYDVTNYQYFKIDLSYYDGSIG